MGKLSAIAERIKQQKAQLEAEADKLAARMDAIDAKAPGAFDAGHRFLTQQEAEVSEIEDALRSLSNFPPDESAASPEAFGTQAEQVPPFRGDGRPGGQT